MFETQTSQTFLEAHTDDRLGHLRAAVHLPLIEDIGRVAELNIGNHMGGSISGIFC